MKIPLIATPDHQLYLTDLYWTEATLYITRNMLRTERAEGKYIQAYYNTDIMLLRASIDLNKT